MPDGTNLTAGGKLTLSASNVLDASATADASATETTTGIGAAVAINLPVIWTEAIISGGASVSAVGVDLSATMTSGSDNVSDFAAEATSGAGATNVGVAGSVALNLVENTSQAFIASGASVAAGGGDVTISAENR